MIGKGESLNDFDFSGWLNIKSNSNERTSFNLSSEDIAKILETDCKFLIGSDAHKKERILKLDRVMELIKKENIPSDRIANLNKLPNFKEKYNNI